MDFNISSGPRHPSRPSAPRAAQTTSAPTARMTRRQLQMESREKARKRIVEAAIKQAATQFPRDLLIHSDKITASKAPSEYKENVVEVMGKTLFKDLGLPERLQKSVEAYKLKTMTPIQSQTFKSILEGKNVVARSPTGTGKTLAFLVPLLARLLSLPDKGIRLQRTDGIRVVILCPTRELALQTYDVAFSLLRPFPYIVPVCLCGGEARSKEKARIRKGANILIGTPGRVLDHVKQTSVLIGTCAPLEAVVLDECDEILDMGLGVTVREIWDALEQGRKQALESAEKLPITGLSDGKKDHIHPIQYILFSATANEKVTDLAKDINSPLFIAVDAVGKASGKNSLETVGTGKDGKKEGVVINDASSSPVALPPNLDHSFVICPLKLRLPLLFGLVAGTSALVFVQTGDEAVFLDSLFRSIPGAPRSFALHGSMAQSDRRDIITRIRKAVAEGEERSVCVFATDVVARGIDLPALGVVVQYDAPAEAAQYVHRIGRTARIGHSGKAFLVLHPSEVEYTAYLSKICTPPHPYQLEAALSGLRKLEQFAGDKSGILSIAGRLQTTVEETVTSDKTLHDRAVAGLKRYISSYSVREKDIKPMFNSRQLHLGHLAKSFGLREAPGELLHPSEAKLSENMERLKRKQGEMPISNINQRSNVDAKNAKNRKKFKLGTKVQKSQGRDERLAGTGEKVALPPPSKKAPGNKNKK